MDQEFDEANRQLEHELWETLDRCAEKGADLSDLRFLAWQCGCSEWLWSGRKNLSHGEMLMTEKKGD